MSQFINVPLGLLDTAVQYVEVSSMTVKRALDEIDVHRQSQKKAADMRADLLNHMLKLKVVPAHQKQAAEAMLGSHAETMALLKSATDKIAELTADLVKLAGTKRPTEPGAAHDGKEATAGADDAFDSLNSPVVGAKTDRIKQSDLPLMKAAGLIR